MARVTRGKTSHARHKKVLKLAKGYRGRNSTNFRIAIERVEKEMSYSDGPSPEVCSGEPVYAPLK